LRERNLKFSKIRFDDYNFLPEVIASNTAVLSNMIVDKTMSFNTFDFVSS
jgi:hypothetical protein